MPHKLSSRRILIGFWIGSGLLSLLAANLVMDYDAVAFALLLPIYLFLLVIYFMPDCFVLGTAALIANILFGHLGRIGRWTATATAMAVALSLAWLASAYANRPLDRQLQTYSAGDRSWDGSLAGTRRLALLGYAHWCAPLCQALLYSGAVKVVLIEPGEPRRRDNGEIDLVQVVPGHRIERRDSCPPTYGYLAPGIQSRIDAGECLISEAANFADADVVVADDVLQNGEDRWMQDPSWLWQPSRSNLYAKRLSVHQVQDGRAREVFRQTALNAEPAATPFLLGPLGVDEEIHLGILRVRRSRGYYDLAKFLEAKLGVSLATINSEPKTP